VGNVTSIEAIKGGREQATQGPQKLIQKLENQQGHNFSI